MDITLDVYNKALEWYQSGIPGKKEAALELFSEEELEKGVSRYNKEKKLKELVFGLDLDMDLDMDLCS
jgi:hypothetical protein